MNVPGGVVLKEGVPLVAKWCGQVLRWTKQQHIRWEEDLLGMVRPLSERREQINSQTGRNTTANKFLRHLPSTVGHEAVPLSYRGVDVWS